MPGIVDPMDWERAQRDAKLRDLEERIEASTDPAERSALEEELHQTRKAFNRRLVRQRLRDIFLPW